MGNFRLPGNPNLELGMAFLALVISFIHALQIPAHLLQKNTRISHKSQDFIASITNPASKSTCRMAMIENRLSDFPA
jgi:hypothetical protein